MLRAGKAVACSGNDQVRNLAEYFLAGRLVCTYMYNTVSIS